MGGKKEGEREGERGHGKGKIKEKVVKRCVLVLSWCLPAGLDTIPQLCLSLWPTHTHTHRIFTVSTKLTSRWTQRGDSSQAMHYTHPGPPPHKHTHTLTHSHKTRTGKDGTEAAHTTNSNITLPARSHPLNLPGTRNWWQNTQEANHRCACVCVRSLRGSTSVVCPL